jgi:hypothetical protein
MKRVVRIAKDLALPLDVVTKTVAILAMRGMGKSYAASVMAEQMLKAGAQVVIVDLLGVFWGLRSSADGRHEGLPIPIFGGDHADVPLDPVSGDMVADLVVNDRLSVVLDLSRMTPADAARFVLTFAERLYHRNRKPLHLILDEADAWAPQRPMHGKERLLGAIEDIVRRGRVKGIGVTLVTQRSAVLNKNVLSQADVLLALRTIAPQDRDAIDAWVEVHGDKEGRKQVMESMASLQIGEAWFWSPGWMGILKRIKINRRETFDSSATPKMGVRVREPKRLSPVDIERIKGQMVSTIEKAKQDDPRELRGQVAALQRELAAGKLTVEQSRYAVKQLADQQVTKEKVVEKRVSWLGKVEIRTLRKATRNLELFRDALVQHAKLFEDMKNTFGSLKMVADRLEAPIKLAMESVNKQISMGTNTPRPSIAYRGVKSPPIPMPMRQPPTQTTKMPGRSGVGPPHISGRSASSDPADVERSLEASELDAPLMAGERRMIGVLKAFGGRELTKIQMTTLAGLSPNSGTTGNYVRNLMRQHIIRLTGLNGRFILLDNDAPSIDMPSGPNAFREMWNAQLMAGERRLLDLVLERGEMSRAELLEQAGLVNSGTSGNYLRKLKRCGLIEIEGQVVRQSPEIKELIG